jgi:hypothetical protein
VKKRQESAKEEVKNQNIAQELYSHESEIMIGSKRRAPN